MVDPYVDKIIGNMGVSASPDIVTKTINKNGKLEKITSVVIIYTDKNQLEVYRESSCAKDKWSCDIYSILPLKFLHKDKKKYDIPPLAPEGAYEYCMENVRFSSMVQLSHAYFQDLADKLKIIENR